MASKWRMFVTIINVFIISDVTGQNASCVRWLQMSLNYIFRCIYIQLDNWESFPIISEWNYTFVKELGCLFGNFKALLNTGREAQLHIESKARKAWLNLKVRLGQPKLQHRPRNGPARQTRRDQLPKKLLARKLPKKEKLQKRRMQQLLLMRTLIRWQS